MRVRASILLAAALSALLLVLGASAVAVWVGARNAQSRVAALHGAHLESWASLAAIRANVYLSSILIRDYLLDSEPGSGERYTEQFEEVRKDTEKNFGYLKQVSQEERQRALLDDLDRELQAYWQPIVLALDWSPEEKRSLGFRVLRQRVRQRAEVFELASRVEKLMRDSYHQERARITSADREFRNSVSWIAGIAMLLGLGIAGVTLARMIELERRSQQAQSELRRLSGQLRTAQEQERKYLSRELHDQVGQMLTGLRMELASMARLHGDAESEFSARIAGAKTTVEQTLRVVRDIAMLLRPSMLDDLGLTPALSWLVKEVSRSSGLDIRSEIDPATDLLPEAHRTCLYRVVQEALTNCSRHAAARQVRVEVKAGDGVVHATIADDGRGFEPRGSKNHAIGLLGMEERVRELGGVFKIVSAPGRGTTVVIQLPLPAEGEISDDPDSDRGRPRDRSDRVEASL
jgi:signal transduction histidine kinase